jgi:NAD(P)-dependent dehydrogenase (short-subunit alcohol dehydrogenase family)
MKTAIITGGSSGIGLASARLLAGEGFRLGLVGRRAEPLKAATQEIQSSGGEAWYSPLDVRDAQAVGEFVGEAVERYSRIDLLVNSAGIFRMLPFEKTSPDFWDQNLGINLTGAYNFCHAAWPHLDGGQIINISSIAGVKPFPGNAAYSASKYGLIGLSEVLALEGKKRGIRVHVVCPGNTETPAWGDQAPAEVQGRMMRPKEVAETIRWLAVSPPSVSFDKIVITPAQDPWKAG